MLILDRDGVINQDSDDFVKNTDEWVPIAGSIDAIARLSQAGFTVVVATNQSGIGRNLFDLDQLEAMHQKMQSLVNAAGGHLSGVFFCPHHPNDDCECRKPRAGMIDSIEQTLSVSAAGATVVGDSLRDLEAGLAKGCKPILVTTGKGANTLAKIRSSNDIRFADLAVYNNLAEAADALINSL